MCLMGNPALIDTLWSIIFYGSLSMRVWENTSLSPNLSRQKVPDLLPNPHQTTQHFQFGVTLHMPFPHYFRTHNHNKLAWSQRNLYLSNPPLSKVPLLPGTKSFAKKHKQQNPLVINRRPLFILFFFLSSFLATYWRNATSSSPISRNRSRRYWGKSTPVGLPRP